MILIDDQRLAPQEKDGQRDRKVPLLVLRGWVYIRPSDHFIRLSTNRLRMQAAWARAVAKSMALSAQWPSVSAKVLLLSSKTSSADASGLMAIPAPVGADSFTILLVLASTATVPVVLLVTVVVVEPSGFRVVSVVVLPL